MKGLVQGVHYRRSVKDFVDKEAPGLIGLVQNLPDGRVEVIAQGDKGLLHNLHEFCLKGPPRAKVLSVEVTAYEGQLGELQSFEIRY